MFFALLFGIGDGQHLRAREPVLGESDERNLGVVLELVPDDDVERGLAGESVATGLLIESHVRRHLRHFADDVAQLGIRADAGRHDKNILRRWHFALRFGGIDISLFLNTL